MILHGGMTIFSDQTASLCGANINMLVNMNIIRKIRNTKDNADIS